MNFHFFTQFWPIQKISTHSKKNLVTLMAWLSFSNPLQQYLIILNFRWYYASKMLEMLDTLFFIVRKKNSQLTFLHVYHHSTMFCLWWIGVKYVPGGSSFLGAMCNCYVHVFMYTYYFLWGQKQTFWDTLLPWLSFEDNPYCYDAMIKLIIYIRVNTVVTSPAHYVIFR